MIKDWTKTAAVCVCGGGVELYNDVIDKAGVPLS